MVQNNNNIEELIAEENSGVVEEPEFELVAETYSEPAETTPVNLETVIFNLKFNYDTLLNFTRDLLTHEQHILFAAKKKEIFG